MGISVASELGHEAVFVLERGTGGDRVQKFTPEGKFVSMWGGKVNKKGGNVCLAAEAAECQGGKAGTGDGEFENPGLQGAIAVGPTGSVYVGDATCSSGPACGRVQRFSAEGVWESSFPVAAVNQVEALAVTSAGNICLTINNTSIYTQESPPTEVFCYSAVGVLEHTLALEKHVYSPGEPTTINLAVDGSGDLYVDEDLYEENQSVTPHVEFDAQNIMEYKENGEEVKRFGIPGGEGGPSKICQSCATEKIEEASLSKGPGGLALSESGGVATSVLLGFKEESVVRSEAVPLPGPSIESEEATAEPGATATLKASINPQSKKTTYHFDYGTEVSNETESASATIEPGATELFKPVTVELKLTGLTPKEIYHFHVVAENENGGPNAGEDVHFEALPAVAVDSVSVGDVTAESAQLEAQIDPTGTATEYHFEYAAAGEGEHVTESVNIGSGSSDVPVSVHIQKLKANTVYFYRVVAKNALGEAIAPEANAPAAELVTQRAGAPFALLDGRSWEQVSPPNKGVASITLQDRGGGPLQSSPGGEALTYMVGGYSESEPEGEPIVSQVVSRHGAGGWSSRDIATPNAQRSNLKVGESGEYWSFSEDLGRSIVEPSPYTPLSEWTTEREGQIEPTQYLRDESKCARHRGCDGLGMLPAARDEQGPVRRRR